MNHNEIIEQIVELIQDKKSFLITAHVYPDGDSLGSVLALGIFLKEKLGKQVDMVQEGEVPPHYRFLPQQNKIKSKEKIGNKYDVVIVCECPDLERTGGVLDKLEPGYILVNIDHHQDNKNYGRINLLDSNAAAVGELIYQILEKLNGNKIDKDIAICLYTAILTDTGGFIYSNTRPETLQMAAKLLNHGVEGWRIAKEVYHTRSLALTQLMGQMMSTIRTVNNGKIVYGYINRDMFGKTGCAPGDTEGFIIPVRAVEGAEIAILFQETDKGEVKLSLRSNGKYDVSEIAIELGGGGHKMAAGAVMPGDLNSVIRTTLEKVNKWTES